MEDVQLLIGREYPNAVIEAIKEAKHSIKILMYDWRWYERQPGSRVQKLNQAIMNAANRGVKVQAVVNKSNIVPILQRHKIQAKVTDVQRKMHAKLVIIDEREIFIGSHNFSVSAFELNHEMSVRLVDPNVIISCSDFFDRVCHS